MLYYVFLLLVVALSHAEWMPAPSGRWKLTHQPCPLSTPATPCYPPPTCWLDLDHHRREKCKKPSWRLFRRLKGVLSRVRLPSFCYSCVWIWTHLTSFTEGPREITITKVGLHTALCNGDSHGRKSRLSFLFLSFYPSRLFWTWGFHPQSTLLASTVQPTRGETERGSRAEGTYLPDCKQAAHVVWCYLIEGFCSGVRFFFKTSPSLAPQPQHHPNIQTCERMSQIIMTHHPPWLFYQSHIWDQRAGDTLRQLNKTATQLASYYLSF